VNKRLIQLDILRCFAVLLVMCRHDFIVPFDKAGWIGVDLFFVLSGFLVSGLLFKEYQQKGAVDARRFFIRRRFKIYPVFWLVLLLYLAYFQYRSIGWSYRQLLAELFFVQNYIPGIMFVTWSLAVEEHFYLILILLTLWAIRKGLIGNGRLITQVCIGIAVICLAWRTGLAFHPPFRLYTHFFPTHLRLDALFAGVFVSWHYHFNHTGFVAFLHARRPLLLTLMAAGLLMPFFFDFWNPLLLSVELTILYIAFAIVLCMVLTMQRSWDAAVWKPLAFTGKCSYSIYLIHQLVGPVAANLFKTRLLPGAPTAIYNLIYLSADLIAGILIYLFFEQYFLRIRDRFSFSRQTAEYPLNSTN